MLTLITGGPGTGKSAAAVDMLMELGKDRELWVSGIPELDLPHQQLEDPHKWADVVPDGAIVVIDEVQRIWRPRGAGTKVPDDVAQLETHRHRGLDFILITQGPNLLDSNIRALVGRHVFLRDGGVLGRWWYEWFECNDQCRSNFKTAPIKKRYKLPKQTFNIYKSAAVHNKASRSFPASLAIAGVAALLVAVLGYRSYASITSKGEPQAQASQAAPATTPKQPPPPAQPAMQTASLKKLPDERIDFLPRISDRPHTAPAYDELRVVVRVPYVSGAMCVNDHCKCYADGEYVPEISSAACKDWAENKPFNPYVLTKGAPVSGQVQANQQLPIPAPGGEPSNVSLREILQKSPLSMVGVSFLRHAHPP